MTNYDPTSQSQNQDLRTIMRRALSNRFVLLAIFAIAIGLTATFSWGWLVAAGIAPILLAAAPCAAMCALGLCMSGMKSKPNTSNANAQIGTATKTDKKECC